MQLIGTHEVFSLLLDLSVLVGRNQLGGYRCVDDVEQSIGSHLPSDITHEVTDERLGHTGIHTVHRHMVTIVSGPAQSEFRKVTRTHDNCILLVRHVHQDLCTFAGL